MKVEMAHPLRAFIEISYRKDISKTSKSLKFDFLLLR